MYAMPADHARTRSAEGRPLCRRHCIPSHNGTFWRGFGSTVLCSVAERSLDAKAELDFAVTGLTWRYNPSPEKT
jgi:hypothetical protein